MAVSDEPGVLRFGSGVGLFGLVSAIASVSETEAETQLENLVRAGLLVRTAEEEIALPAALMPRARRSETARINGLKGGRPRKSAGPQGQTTLPLPILGGGAAKPTETKSEPNWVPDSTTTTDSSTSSRSSEATNWVSIAREACELADLDDATGLHTFGIVRDWLSQGATRALILEVIEARRGSHVRSLRYFTRAIQEAVATASAQQAARPAPMSAREREARRQWNEDHDAWYVRGRRGPMPDLQTYLARSRSDDAAAAAAAAA
jgi:hypothetical protein